MKKYNINGKEYQFKEKYTLKEWGKILNILSGVDKNNVENAVIMFLMSDKIGELLSVIFGCEIGELYEEDMGSINEAIQDFFLRRNSLMKSIERSSKKSTRN